LTTADGTGTITRPEQRPAKRKGYEVQEARAQPPLLPVILVAGGGVLSLVSAFLRWGSISLGQLAQNRVLTTDGVSTFTGKIVVGCGIGLLVVGVVMWQGPTVALRLAVAAVAIALGLTVAILAARDILIKGSQFDTDFRLALARLAGEKTLSDEQLRLLKDFLGVKLTLGPGPYMAVAGGVMALMGGLGGVLLRGIGQPLPAAEPESGPSREETQPP
jgi:hypothetical protein